MAYEIVEENTEIVGPFGDDNFEFRRPKYRCKYCSKTIDKDYYRGRGDCYQCYQGNLPLGDQLSQVWAAGVYITDMDHPLKQTIFDLKDYHKNIALFGEILEWELEERYNPDQIDMIIVPPSGEATSDEENHMIPVGEELGKRTGIPFENLAYKKEDYPSQKKLSFEERIENVRGKIGCRDDNLPAEEILVVDDIATSCATLAETSRALLDSGVENAIALAIARDENTGNLEHAGVLRRDE